MFACLNTNIFFPFFFVFFLLVKRAKFAGPSGEFHLVFLVEFFQTFVEYLGILYRYLSRPLYPVSCILYPVSDLCRRVVGLLLSRSSRRIETTYF